MMDIGERVRKTLAQLGVNDAQGVESLFAELRKIAEQERAELLSRGAPDQSQRERACKALRDRWLARKGGFLSQVDENWLKPAGKELKPAVGRQFNNFRQFATCFEREQLAKDLPLKTLDHLQDDSFQPMPRQQFGDDQQRRIARQVAMGNGGEVLPAQETAPDLTLPGLHRPLGSIHPITRMQREIEEIFLRLGFWVETGPEIESTYYNFDALNIPDSHPARDDWDTFYIDAKTVLRTHTSPVQIRAMEKYGAPLYIIIPGKCYRHDNPDATHYPMFHQIEGLAIDKDITFADLKGTLDFFAKMLFGEKVRTRFQPSFFPFTEPSGEVAVSCFVCDGQGCRVCKESGWIELMGCGMVHPQVLRYGGIDPDKYSGWAFGLGVDRFAMVKHDINDIQLFFQGDVRFLEQF
jgi:phenylalanyl-tRNA synthetase alpha chain